MDVGVGVGSQTSHRVGPLATQICMLNKDCSRGAYKELNKSPKYLIPIYLILLDYEPGLTFGYHNTIIISTEISSFKLSIRQFTNENYLE